MVAPIYLSKIVFPDVDPAETLAKDSTTEWKSLREWVIGVWDLYGGKRGNGVSEALEPAASEVSQGVGDGGLVEVGRKWNIHGSRGEQCSVSQVSLLNALRSLVRWCIPREASQKGGWRDQKALWKETEPSRLTCCTWDFHFGDIWPPGAQGGGQRWDGTHEA